MSGLNVEKFKKVWALAERGATDGEKAAALHLATGMAERAGMTLEQALAMAGIRRGGDQDEARRRQREKDEFRRRMEEEFRRRDEAMRREAEGRYQRQYAYQEEMRRRWRKQEEARKRKEEEGDPDPGFWGGDGWHTSRRGNPYLSTETFHLVVFRSGGGYKAMVEHFPSGTKTFSPKVFSTVDEAKAAAIQVRDKLAERFGG